MPLTPRSVDISTRARSPGFHTCAEKGLGELSMTKSRRWPDKFSCVTALRCALQIFTTKLSQLERKTFRKNISKSCKTQGILLLFKFSLKENWLYNVFWCPWQPLDGMLLLKEKHIYSTAFFPSLLNTARYISKLKCSHNELLPTVRGVCFHWIRSKKTHWCVLGRPRPTAI